MLYKFFKKVYAPFLLSDSVRVVVMVSFIGWLCSSIAVIHKIEVGLDQELAMPQDSYLQQYFDYLKKYLQVGPPVYFIVTEGYDYSKVENQARLCFAEQVCDQDSVGAKLKQLTLLSNRTYVTRLRSYWLDQYIQYMRSKDCCFETVKSHDFCYSKHKEGEEWVLVLTSYAFILCLSYLILFVVAVGGLACKWYLFLPSGCVVYSKTNAVVTSISTKN